MTPSLSYAVRVVVRDQAGRPVRMATVEIAWGENCTFPPALTSMDGTVNLLVPPEAKVYNLLALKPGAGLDYFENYASWPPGDEVAPLPSEIVLVLDGAREVL